MTVRLGSASYEADGTGSSGNGETWLLDTDLRGRGLRPAPGPAPRIVTSTELARALLEAERVISMS